VSDIKDNATVRSKVIEGMAKVKTALDTMISPEKRRLIELD